ncbi:MAG: hypothetical protein NVS9B13_20620 [Candidatus Acidiferrum sp.]
MEMGNPHAPRKRMMPGYPTPSEEHSRTARNGCATKGKEGKTTARNGCATKGRKDHRRKWLGY